MAETLTSIRSKVGDLLQDPTAIVFDNAILDGSIRAALAEYSLAKGGPPQTISGLDGAAVTTVPDLETVVVVIGASGFAVAGRVLKRSESFNFKQYSSKDVKAWADNQLKQFRAYLALVSRGSFRGAAVIPWPAKGWALDGWDPNSGAGL